MSMGITLEELSLKLEQYHPRLYISDTAGSTIKAVRLLLSDMHSFEADTLYAGNISDLPDLIQNEACINLLCTCTGTKIETETQTDLSERYPNVNWILINSRNDVYKLFNIVQDILASNLRQAQSAELLLDALIHRRGIQQILEAGYDVLRNPIGIGDPSTKLVAHFRCIFPNEPVWNKQIEQGYFSHEITNTQSFFDLNSKIFESNLPVYISNAYGLSFNSITGKIKVDNSIAAFLTVFEYEQPFRDGDIELVALLCDVVSAEMQKNKSYKNAKGTAFESFIISLLESGIPDDATVNERILALNMNIKEDLYILSVDARQLSSLNFHPIYLISLMENMVGNSKAILYSDYILMMISRSSDANPMADSDVEKLNFFLKKNRIVAGLSRRFTNLKEIKTYFMQAQLAIELSVCRGMEHGLQTYEKVVPYHMLKLCSVQGDMINICHPALHVLMEYDKKNKTNYTETLHMLLKHQGNQAETASALNIHRATMIYRMEKIRKITRLDLKDYETINHLNISFMVLKYLSSEIK